MAALATGQAQLNTFTPTSYAPGVSSGVRQALALVHGAVETNQTIRREARFIPRREPAPFEDKVEIRTAPAEGEDAKPASGEAKEPVEIRQLSLTGQPAAEKPAAPAGRGNLVDIDA
jgi:hypothetical protein